MHKPSKMVSLNFLITSIDVLKNQNKIVNGKKKQGGTRSVKKRKSIFSKPKLTARIPSSGLRSSWLGKKRQPRKEHQDCSIHLPYKLKLDKHLFIKRVYALAKHYMKHIKKTCSTVMFWRKQFSKRK